MKVIKVGGQFSGVGAFDQALNRLGVDYENVYQCDFDKFARQTYLLNFEEPKYYIKDVKDTPIDEITESEGAIDIMMFSPPCQAFSLAGKRGGETDEKGILFYNSHEFIKKNKPRFFCFENVEGLLSDDGGKTFAKWVDLLGGKSVNGNPVIFPHENSVPYHIYYKVINALDHNIPQNRKRIFIVGVRDDRDNMFKWKKEQNLSRFLKDVLESEVDQKYFLSEKILAFYKNHGKKHLELGNGFSFKIKDLNGYAYCIRAKTPDAITDNFILVKSATKCGYEFANLNEDSINFEHPNSLTRRGRVGRGFAQTLTTSCNQGVAESQEKIRRLTPLECFRLMDFNSDFKWLVSDSQAYKQAGNSICVGVLAGIMESIIKIINET